MSRINNSFRFTGNLGAEPDIRYNQQNGNPIAGFSLGVNTFYKNKETGERVELIDWIDLTTYYKNLVDVVQKFVRKGSSIQVRGYVRKRVWDSKDRKDNEGNALKDSRMEFIVTELQLLGRPKDESAPAAGSTYSVPDGVDADSNWEDDVPL